MDFKNMITLISFLLVVNRVLSRDCTTATTCIECLMEETRCYWSSEMQVCQSGNGGAYNMTVSRWSDCPGMASTYNGHTYRVFVVNDVVGLLRHMDRVGVACSRGGRPGYVASVLLGSDGGDLLCSGPAGSNDDKFRFTFGPTGVVLRSATNHELSVVSFEPEQAWWNARTVELAITVSNRSTVYQWFTPEEVTVAGRPCTIVKHFLDYSKPDVNANQVWCKMSLFGPVAGESGPVRVYFGPSMAYKARVPERRPQVSIAVESAREFRVLAPIVTGVEGPRCGPTRGGTLLTVLGTNFNPSISELQVNLVHGGVTGNRAKCELVHHNETRLMCRMEPWSWGTTPSRLAVLWDGGMEMRAPDFRFAYAVNPEPQAGQRLAGIASGGTMLTVAWNSLICVASDSVRFYVRLADGKRLYARCRILDVRTVECQMPAMRFNGPAGRFDCGFELEFAGQPQEFRCDKFTIEFRVHADPLFTRFEPVREGSAVVVYGPGLQNAGFVPDDVTVLLQYSETGHLGCDVHLIAPDRVECTPTNRQSKSMSIMSLRHALVYVGDAPPILVSRN